MNMLKAEKEDSPGQPSHDFVGTHSESLVPASLPPRARGGGYGSRGGTPNGPFHHTRPQGQPKIQTHTGNQSSAGQEQQRPLADQLGKKADAESRRSRAAGHRTLTHILMEQVLSETQPSSGPASQQKKYNQIQKTNTGDHTGRDSHRSKVTRSTSTLRLHKTSPGTDDTTAPPRHRQETEAGRAEE